MYITAGTFNIILRQLSLLEMDEAEVFSILGIDSSLFEKATNKIDSSIVGQSLEYMASQKPNIRIGLKMGFNFPVSVMGVILNLYQNCRTLKMYFKNHLFMLLLSIRYVCLATILMNNIFIIQCKLQTNFQKIIQSQQGMFTSLNMVSYFNLSML